MGRLASDQRGRADIHHVQAYLSGIGPSIRRQRGFSVAWQRGLSVAWQRGLSVARQRAPRSHGGGHEMSGPTPASGQAPAIRTERLGRRFGELWALRNVDLELAPGEVFGLLGPNGAGKTTTVRLLTSLIAPTEGRAWVDGYEVTADADAVRARIGILTETPGLYDRLTATQNLDFFARLHGLDSTTRAERIERFLRLFELWDRRDDLTGGFSKGMKQKLAIARALIHEPSVVFLDEPTAALDPEAAFVVREAIASLRGAGRTIVLCTHNLDEAERLCDRIAFVRGELLRVDRPARLRGGDGNGGRPSLRVRLVEPPSPTQLAAVAALPGVTDVASRRGDTDAAGRAGAGATDGAVGTPADDPASPTSHDGESADATLTCRLTDLRRDAPAVVRALVEAGAQVIGVHEESRTLEDVYFEVMGRRPQVEDLA
jgi:ABC-2 type transport system ATP-binding protein